MMFLASLLRGDLPVLMLLVLGDMTGSLPHDVPGPTVERRPSRPYVAGFRWYENHSAKLLSGCMYVGVSMIYPPQV